MQHPPCASNTVCLPALQTEHHVPAQPSPEGALQTDACMGFSTQPLVPSTPVDPCQPTAAAQACRPSQKGKLCCAVEAPTGEWHKLCGASKSQLSATGVGAW